MKYKYFKIALKFKPDYAFILTWYLYTTGHIFVSSYIYIYLCVWGGRYNSVGIEINYLELKHRYQDFQLYILLCSKVRKVDIYFSDSSCLLWN